MRLWLNLKQHGLDFVDAPSVFEGPTFTFEDDRFEYDEQRLVTLGFLGGMNARTSSLVPSPDGSCNKLVRIAEG